MLDLVLGALLVGLVIRGWTRGLIREVISLTVLVVGTVAAFRLSTPLGAVFANMSGASPNAARWVAGVVIFLAVSMGAAVVSRILHLGMRILPGVSTLNRAAGAALSLIAITLVVTLALSIATVADVPEPVADELENSTVAAALTDPTGLPQRALGFLSGDRVMEVSLRIRELTGGEYAVARQGEPLVFPSATSDELERLPRAEAAVFDLLNRERVAADVAPVLRSSGLDRVAFDLALAGYSNGTFVLPTDSQRRELLNRSGLPASSSTLLAALAASPEMGHTALADGASMELREATRAGIAVVQGPTGLLVIEVIAG
ncbi:MAG: CvpA family protein [Acidimicrobiia bacterium]|nr:CvpA family protein [Acidimicrobiia bacterium]